MGLQSRSEGVRASYRPPETLDPFGGAGKEDGVSYLFAGARQHDLGLALEMLHSELGVKRLEVNGGGITNGAFLRAGLIDELSLAIFPAVDGTKGAPCVFDTGEDETGAAAPLRSMTLASSEVLECGAVWLRYGVQSG
jgi:riboflavin biosynthesis pyrimidine reductase